MITASYIWLYIALCTIWDCLTSLLSNCNQHDKMQLFAKFKKILQRGFRATLNFQKFKVQSHLKFSKI